jgi:hypothetical protein
MNMNGFSQEILKTDKFMIKYWTFNSSGSDLDLELVKIPGPVK